jgi:hypothetical protein
MRHFETVHGKKKSIIIGENLEIVPRAYKNEVRIQFTRKTEQHDDNKSMMLTLKQYENLRVLNFQIGKEIDLGYGTSCTFDGFVYTLKEFTRYQLASWKIFKFDWFERDLMLGLDDEIESGIAICQEMLKELISA